MTTEEAKQLYDKLVALTPSDDYRATLKALPVEARIAFVAGGILGAREAHQAIDENLAELRDEVASLTEDLWPAVEADL